MPVQSYRDSPTFYADTFLASTDLNIISSNLTLAESESRRYPEILPFNTTNGQYVSGDGRSWKTGNWIFRGGFQYRVGMTTATFKLRVLTAGNMTNNNELEIWFTINNTTNIRVFHQGILTAVAAGTQIINIDLATHIPGYTDGWIVDVYMVVSYDAGNTNDPNDLTGNIEIYEAYVGPLNGITTSVLNPTTPLPLFSTPGTVQLSVSKLNDLSNKTDWLIQRMNLVPRLPQVCYKNRLFYGGRADETWTQSIYLANINTGNATHIRIYMTYTAFNSNTQFRITINGVSQTYNAVNSVPTPTTGLIELPLSTFSTSANTQYLVNIEQVLGFVTGSTQGHRVIINGVELYKASEPALTVLPTFTENTNISYTTLISNLNTLITTANAIETTITNNSIVWDRAQMFRSKFVVDDFQDDYWEEEIQHRQVRAGDVLLVRGRNIKLGYGATTYAPIEGDQEELDISNTYEHSLIGNDLETKAFYLNQFEGLFPGTEYFLRGSVLYAAEFLQ